MRSQYELQDTNNQNTPYDYGSIMHYAKQDFTLNSAKPAFIPKTKGITAEIGQRKGMSLIDIQRLNKLYGCVRTSTTGPTQSTSKCNEDNILCGERTCYNPTNHACSNGQIILCKKGQLPCGVVCYNVANQTCTADHKVAVCPAGNVFCGKNTCYDPAKYTCKDGKIVSCQSGQRLCGKACYTTLSQTCVEGQIRSCPAGKVLCDPGHCYDPKKHTCKDGKFIECQRGQLPCGTTCYNTGTQTCGRRNLLLSGG
ncbi:hypothetical protein BV898_10761 [Hypsibius exemplaris]|uniref:Metalloendopeptidase n=1 Tax=Hypsibius exemplaris TaxID=2072580 RepID=A0A1W0WIG3_HYPEX|nr:hypothetical protein BV898_10761 [Hypsibius exemplaris]